MGNTDRNSGRIEKMGKKKLVNISLVLLLCIFCICNRNPREVRLEIGVFVDSGYNGENMQMTERIEKSIEEFEKKYPNVIITFESGIRREDYLEWTMGKYLTGDEPDILILSSDVFNILASRGGLLELEEFMTKDELFREDMFYRVGIEAGQYENRQYALPVEADPTIMCVNTTLLQKNKIVIPPSDWTWSDFHAICRQTTKDTDGDGIVDQFGVCNYTWRDAVYSNGEMLFDEDGSENYLNDQDVINAVNYVYKIQMLNGGKEVEEQEFVNGNVAFMPMSLEDYHKAITYPYGSEGYKGFSWQYTTMPAGPKGKNISQVKVLQAGISRRSKKAELAWEFLKILGGGNCSKEESGTGEAELLDLVMEDGVVVSEFPGYEEAIKRMDDGVEQAMKSERNIRASILTLQKEIDSFLKNE